MNKDVRYDKPFKIKDKWYRYKITYRGKPKDKPYYAELEECSNSQTLA